MNSSVAFGFVRAAILCILVASLSGCFVIFPKTEDLRNVHKTYRDEFHSAVDVAPLISGGGDVEGALIERDAFEKTLAAIADYQRTYPDATKENAHLTVLQGMIYLQTGNIGLASIMREDVENAGGELSGDSASARDALFAMTYADLLQGWKPLAAHYGARQRVARLEADKAACTPESGCDRDPIQREINETKQSFYVNRNWETALPGLVSGACGIKGKLDRENEAGRLKGADGDQGASYLAATGAIFLQWSDYLCNELAPVKDNLQGEKKRTYDAHCPAMDDAAGLLAARDLVGAYLPPVQRTYLHEEFLAPGGASAAIPDQSEQSGELAYLDLYFDLNRLAASRLGADEQKTLERKPATRVCPATGD